MGSKAKKKVRREGKRMVAAFEKEEPLVKDDITCKICFSIFLDPVTFPCNHSLCRPCFDSHIKETSLKCPFCNTRVSIWTRQAIRNDTVTNLVFKERIEREFPEEIAALKRQAVAALEDEENVYDIRVTDISKLLEGNDDEDDELELVRDGQFCEPGEIAKDLEVIYYQHRQDLEKERQEELDASQTLIEQIIKEEEEDEQPVVSQIETDFQLAQRLQLENSPPNLRTNVAVSSQIVSAPKKSISELLISRIKGGKKRRQSNPSPLPSSKRNKNSKSKSAKFELAKQTKIVNYFATSPQSSASSSSLLLSRKENESSTEGKQDEIDSVCINSQDNSSVTSSNWSEWLPFSWELGRPSGSRQKSSRFKEKPFVENSISSSPIMSSSTEQFLSSTSSLPPHKSETDFSSDDDNDFALDSNGNYIGLKSEEQDLEEFEPNKDLLILMRNEDERVLEERRRQEEADLKLAMELQASYDTGTTRGRKGSISQKYSLRNWIQSS